MFKNYLKIAWRNLLRNKTFSLINILGLAVGMGVCLLILQYVSFELSYDQFHSNAQNTYRITQTATRNGEELGTGVNVTYALGPRGKETIPEIESFVRIHPEDGGLIVINAESNVRYQEDRMWYVDSNFLAMFDFSLKYGNPELILDEKHNVVITEQMATKYFGATNPLGKPLRVSGGTLSGEFIVTGVLKTLPNNSHLQFDFLLPMDFLLENFRQYREEDGWVWENFVTYIKVNESVDINAVGEKYDQLVITNIGEKLARLNLSLKTGFQPVVDVHLKSDNLSGDTSSNNGNIQNVRFFAIIAIFILIIAWVNYINLTTAGAMLREKEVGVRKSVGALKKQLICQFMAESVMINFMAAMLAVGIAYFMLPVLNHILGQKLEFVILQRLEFWQWFTLAIIFGSILSGLYPAFVLSSFKPVSIFRPAISPHKGGLGMRKGLIVFQFLASILLISGTYLVYKQITFMKNQDLGIDMEKILVVKGPRVILEEQRSAMGSLYKTFKAEGLNHHSISAVSATSHVPGKGYMFTGGFRKLGEPKNAEREGNAIFVDADFAKIYDFESLSGEPFTEEMPERGGLIINEVGVKVFGLGSAEDALNEELIVSLGDTLGSIVGVVKNVYWSSLNHAHPPIIFWLDHTYGGYFSIKMNLSDIQNTIAHVESAYHSVFPDDPFHYSFLDDDFNNQYKADLQFQNLFAAFSLLAIFIACMGLFALVSFSATLKTKEIGVRKVLGANVGNLMLLLYREYLMLLAFAVILAIPVVVWGAGFWLNNYAYRIDVGWDLIVIPGLLLFLIALLTVSYRTYIAANSNPVESLKSE